MSRDKWPGTDDAYTFVLPSYQWMLTRLEAADSRIQALQTFVLTVTTAIPAIVTTASGPNGQAKLTSQWFFYAMLAAGVAIVIGVIGRMSGSIMLIDPSLLHTKEWLSLESDAFKRDMIYFAGQHYERN